MRPERSAFHFNPNKCTGCQACELACAIENELDDMSWRQVVTFNESRRPGAPVIHLSLACNHCDDAPCAKHCPALAYTKDPVTGRVDLDPEHCIGCKYCSWACPYDAPKFDAPRGVMTKCTFCGHRQDRGLVPACVEMCPTGALGFGEHATLSGVDRMVGFPTVEPGPAIRFVPWQEKPNVADGSTPVPEPPPVAATPSKISLGSEWPLLVFTLSGALLVAAWTASAIGPFRLHPLAFFALAALSLGVSSAHLGQKRRAWRAVLNLRRSWLSREIVFYSGFVGLGALQTVLGSDDAWLTGSTLLFGWLALFAMDRVYDIVRAAEAKPLHSADVVLTGLLVTTLLLANLPWVAAVAFVKLVLYLVRKRRRGAGPLWSAVRVAFGFVLPLAMGWIDPQRWSLWAFAGTLVGELIDRGELYTELEVPSPRRQMALELAARARPLQ